MKLVAKEGERVGLFGGSFDPPHWGHFILAVDAFEAAGLDQLWFLPAGRNPHKETGPWAPAADRLAMLEAAIAAHPRLSVCPLETERPGPSYAVETVATLEDRFPGVEWFWLMGADQFPDLHRWHEIERLVRKVTFLVFARAAAEVSPPALPDFRCERVSRRLLELSSTEIRARLAGGLPVDFLVPPPVLERIQQAGLYQRPSDESVSLS